jgi:selenocysteine lyase/cysteine desulfurase
VSYGAAIVARNLETRSGGRIVMLGEQFPSNVYAWRSLAARTGLELTVVEPPDSAQRAQAWNDAVLAAIDGDTVLVALPQVHWTDGTRFDLESAGEAARRHGAALVVDATQSAGAMPFDVTRIGADAVLCAAYKWLLGPYSTGFAWLGARFANAEPLEETWIGRGGSEDFQGLVNYRDDYQPGAARFDVGERSNFVLLPMLVAALEHVVAWRADRIQQYCAELAAGAITTAQELGFTVEDSAWRGEHLFGLRAPDGIDLRALQESLRTRNVHVSLRGSAVRVSPNVYNDAADMAAFTDALRAGIDQPRNVRNSAARSSSESVRRPLN